MRAVDIIMRKRAGAELSRDELAFLVAGFVAGEIPDYQISAWAMAVFFQGMSAGETAAFIQIIINKTYCFHIVSPRIVIVQKVSRNDKQGLIKKQSYQKTLDR